MCLQCASTSNLKVPLVLIEQSIKIKTDLWYIWVKFICISTPLLFLHVYGGVYSLSFHDDLPFEDRRGKRKKRGLMWVFLDF